MDSEYKDIRETSITNLAEELISRLESGEQINAEQKDALLRALAELEYTTTEPLETAAPEHGPEQTSAPASTEIEKTKEVDKIWSRLKHVPALEGIERSLVNQYVTEAIGHIYDWHIVYTKPPYYNNYPPMDFEPYAIKADSSIDFVDLKNKLITQLGPELAKTFSIKNGHIGNVIEIHADPTNGERMIIHFRLETTATDHVGRPFANKSTVVINKNSELINLLRGNQATLFSYVIRNAGIALNDKSISLLDMPMEGVNNLKDSKDKRPSTTIIDFSTKSIKYFTGKDLKENQSYPSDTELYKSINKYNVTEDRDTELANGSSQRLEKFVQDRYTEYTE